MEQFDQVVRLNLTGSVLPADLPATDGRTKKMYSTSPAMAAFRPMTRVVGYAAAKAGSYQLHPISGHGGSNEIWRRDQG